MPGWYDLKKSSNGQYTFALKAGNGETILTSEMYKEKASAQNGIASVQKNCVDDARYERKQSSSGRHYFNLLAANHQVIGTSEMYSSAGARDEGIASVQANGTSTTVKEPE